MRDPKLNFTLLEEGMENAETRLNNLVYRLGAAYGAVEEFDVNNPPASPKEGEAYYVGSSPTSDWVGNGSQLAFQFEGDWEYLIPKGGFTFCDIDSDRYTTVVDAIPFDFAARDDISFLNDSGGNYSPSAWLGTIHYLFLDGNDTIGALSNGRPGYNYVFMIEQQTGGPWEATWSSNYYFPGGTDPSLSNTAGDIDVFWFIRSDSGQNHLLASSLNSRNSPV